MWVRSDRRFSVLMLLALVAPIFAAACAPEAGKPKLPEGPFTVSEYFVASGAMGDGATPGNLVINQEAGCKDRPAGARGSCYSFQYVASAPYDQSGKACQWAGVFWQYPENNWGNATGLPIPGSKLSKVTFQAAVGDGTEAISFQIGGIGAPPGSDGAPAPPPTDSCPPTTTSQPNYDQLLNKLAAMVGTDWQKLEIPIKAREPAMTIDSLIGAFAWSVSATTTPLPKTIYIDDLAYE
jgi:hypothetical protein